MNIFDVINKNHLETQDRLEYSTPDKLSIALIEKKNINIFKMMCQNSKNSPIENHCDVDRKELPI